MRRVMGLYLTSAIGILIGTIVAHNVADAQELEWYKSRSLYDGVYESIQVAEGVEEGVLVSGHVIEANRVLGISIQLLAPDGSRIWKVVVHTDEAYPVQNSQTQLFASHPEGGWWCLERRKEIEPIGKAERHFFVRHHISPEGKLISSTSGEGQVTEIFRDGTVAGAPSNYYGVDVVWTIHDVDAGRTDSITVNLERAMSYFEELPKVVWTKVLRNHAYVLLTDPFIGKCLLVATDLRSGMMQAIKLDDVPTTGIDGLVTRDKSVVILGRESRWKRGRSNLVLIRPQVEGEPPERIRLPITSSDFPPRFEGELSTGEYIIAMNTEPNTFNDRTLYRISADASRVSSLTFYNVIRWTMSIAPNDMMYVQWVDRMGKVIGSGNSSSGSSDVPPADPWVELDLSGVE